MARYRELRDTLAREISDGVYPVGSRFPTDAELCDRFLVSRHTVREAVRGLQEQGLLDRHAGSGTLVRAAAPRAVYAQTLDTLQQLSNYAAETRLEARQVGFVTVRPRLAEILGGQLGEKWLRVAGIRWLEGATVPLCWTEIFVGERFAELRHTIKDDERPLYERIRQSYGVETAEIQQQIKAVALPADIAAHLDAEAGAAALLVRRRYLDDQGQPFEISLSLHPGDRYAYTARLAREHLGQPPQGGDL